MITQLLIFLGILHFALAVILTAMLISFIFGPKMIAWLKLKQHGGQPIREDGPQSHLLTEPNNGWADDVVFNRRFTTFIMG